MKTNTLLILSTALLFSGASLRANDSLCGGADDDQIILPTKLCGGMDDDQLVPPVLRGFTTDPLGLPPPPPPRPVIGPIDGTDIMRADFAMWTALTGPVMPPVNKGIVSDSLGICGGNGSDSIVGGDGSDFVRQMQRLVLEICGGNGNDSLWGGGGTDEITGDGIPD